MQQSFQFLDCFMVETSCLAILCQSETVRGAELQICRMAKTGFNQRG